MGESHYREFKTGVEGPPGSKVQRKPDSIRRDIAEALVAFANADGGELLVGVEDDGQVTGLPHSSEAIDKILRAPEELVHPTTPLAGVTRARVETDGVTVLYLSIGKSTSFVHQLSDGRCVRRQDLETIPAVPAVLQLERDEALSRDYDRQYVDGAHSADLDQDLLAKATRAASPGATPEMLLQQWNLADFANGTLRFRRAAMLLFARDIDRWHPRCSVRVLRIDGSELLTGSAYNVVFDQTANGPIVSLIPNAWDLLRPHLSRTALSNRGRFDETVLFPEDACLEALVNSIAHRSYSAEGRMVEVMLFSDRVEFTSPGRLLDTVPIDRLRSGGGVHESRNTHVARVLRELGFMREMGEGVRRMFALMRDSDLVDPEFAQSDDSFTTILNNRSCYGSDAIQWLAGYKNFLLSRDEQRVVLLCADGQPKSPNEITAAIGTTDIDEYRVVITQLQNKGLAYNSMEKRAVQAKARRERRQPRDIARVLIRTPADATGYYDDLLGALRAAAGSFPLTKESVGDVRVRLDPSSPYATTDGQLRTSLRVLQLIDESGMPTPSLASDFRSLGVVIPPLPADSTSQTDPQPESDAPASSGTAGAVEVFAELFAAAQALGVELTLQSAGNRMRARLGADPYQRLVARGGLRDFVEGTGVYFVEEDHGRHIVRRRDDT